ncbi:hypothetical protein EXIGLDRAFT_784450 [Exidia glandulosa HHB12029]|uniref:Uncharacterized protein n=1 Tax=Exidia glandulosa HHB12029 TaxID=1314781 RepID=A0A166MG80_EXIGL|nr:hypothetical protein EXIGLDRAFT_784450 [Exidia glandulosa HHB12029]
MPSLRRITFIEQLLRGRRIDTLEIRNMQFNGSVQRLEALADDVTTTFDPVEQPSMLFG